MKTVWVVSDSLSFYKGLKTILEIKLGWKIENKKKDSLLHPQEITPNMVILDTSVFSLQMQNSLEVLKNRDCKCVIFDIADYSTTDFNLFNAFLKKSMPTEDLIRVLNDVLEYDETYVHSDAGVYFLNNYSKLMKESR